MQWLTLKRVTNYVEKHRLLSTDYKSPSNGQSGEKKGRGEARHQARPGILSLRRQKYFVSITDSAFPQLPHQPAAQLLKSTVREWIIIVVKALRDQSVIFSADCRNRNENVVV